MLKTVKLVQTQRRELGWDDGDDFNEEMCDV